MKSASGRLSKAVPLAAFSLLLAVDACRAGPADPPPPAYAIQRVTTTGGATRQNVSNYPDRAAYQAALTSNYSTAAGLFANPVYVSLSSQSGAQFQAVVTDGTLQGIRIRTSDNRTFFVFANQNGSGVTAVELKKKPDGTIAPVPVRVVDGTIQPATGNLSGARLESLRTQIQRLQGLRLADGTVVFDGGLVRSGSVACSGGSCGGAVQTCAGRRCGGDGAAASQPEPPSEVRTPPESIIPRRNRDVARPGEFYLSWGPGDDGDQNRLMLRAAEGQEDAHVGYVTTNDLLFFFGNANPMRFDVSRERAEQEWTLYGRQGDEVAADKTSKRMGGYFEFAFRADNVEQTAGGRWVRDLLNEEIFHVATDNGGAKIYGFMRLARESVLGITEAPSYIGFNGFRYVLNASANQFIQYSPAPTTNANVPAPGGPATQTNSGAAAGGRPRTPEHPVMAAIAAFDISRLDTSYLQALAAPLATTAMSLARSFSNSFPSFGFLPQAPPHTAPTAPPPPSSTAAPPPATANAGSAAPPPTATNVPANAPAANPQLDAGLQLLAAVNPDGLGRTALWNKKVKTMAPPNAEQVAALEAVIQGTRDDDKRKQAIELLGAFSFMSGADPAARTAMLTFMLTQLGPASALSNTGKTQLAEELGRMLGEYQEIRPGESFARQIWDGFHGLVGATAPAGNSDVRGIINRYLSSAPPPPPSPTRPADEALQASLATASAYLATLRRVEGTVGGETPDAKSLAALGNGNMPSPAQVLALRALAQFGQNTSDRASAFHYLRVAAQLQAGSDPQAALSTVDFLLGLLNPASPAHPQDRKGLIENLQALATSPAGGTSQIGNEIAGGFSNLLRAAWPESSAYLLKDLSFALLNANPQRYQETLFTSARNRQEIASGLALLASYAPYRRPEAMLGYTSLLNGILADSRTPVEAAVALVGAIQNLENSRGHYGNANLAALLGNALENTNPAVHNAAYQAIAASGSRIRSRVMSALLDHVGAETEPATVRAGVEALAAMIPPPTRTTYSGRGRNTTSRTNETFDIPGDAVRSQALDVLVQVALKGTPPEGAARAARLLGTIVQPTEVVRLRQLAFMAQNPQFAQFPTVQQAARAALGMPDGSGERNLLTRLQGRGNDRTGFQNRMLNIRFVAGKDWNSQQNPTPQSMMAAYNAFTNFVPLAGWDVDYVEFQRRSAQ